VDDIPKADDVPRGEKPANWRDDLELITAEMLAIWVQCEIVLGENYLSSCSDEDLDLIAERLRLYRRHGMRGGESSVSHRLMVLVKGFKKCRRIGAATA
jgi:hypothetical protein